MVHYIVQLAQGILAIMDGVENSTGPTADGSVLASRLRQVVPQTCTLVQELNRLDPRDFLPDARHEFLLARLDLELRSKQWTFSGIRFSLGFEPPLTVLVSDVVQSTGRFHGCI